MASVAGDNLIDLNRSLIYAVLLLSLVLLTGNSGQISLAQYVFFGLGASGSVERTASAPNSDSA